MTDQSDDASATERLLAVMPVRDRLTTRMVVAYIGAAHLVALVLIGVLLVLKIDVPSELWLHCSTALGLLGGILITTRSGGTTQ